MRFSKTDCTLNHTLLQIPEYSTVFICTKIVIKMFSPNISRKTQEWFKTVPFFLSSVIKLHHDYNESIKNLAVHDHRRIGSPVCGIPPDQVRSLSRI